MTDTKAALEMADRMEILHPDSPGAQMIRALVAERDAMEKQWALRAVCECGYIGVGLTHCAACDTFIPMRLEKL